MLLDWNNIPSGGHVLNAEAQVRREIRPLFCVERSTYFTFFYRDFSGTRREGRTTGVYFRRPEGGGEKMGNEPSAIAAS